MNIFHAFAADLQSVLATLPETAALPEDMRGRATVEPPRDPSHGDLSTNAAMVLAKEAKTNPRALGEKIAAALAATGKFAKVEVAGPGFINIALKPEAFEDVIRAANRIGADYGRGTLGHDGAGKPRKINIEYVSANPTGPMHVGHGRGAVYGDALANLLAFSGYDVTREYYINDAGSQVDVLARSAFHRYREALGRDVGPVGEGLYPGDYLVPVGKALAEKHGDALEKLPETDWLPILRRAAIDGMMDMIRDDLAAIDIRHDVFFSEATLQNEEFSTFKRNFFTKLSYRQAAIEYAYQVFSSFDPKHNSSVESNKFHFLKQFINNMLDGRSLDLKINSETEWKIHLELEISRALTWDLFPVRDKVSATIEDFRNRGLIYQGRLEAPKGQKDADWEDREQTLFRATDFGDDVDRPLLKSDGGYTYFASDIAYHANKFERGFAEMIDVWGADHGGYVKRMQAAVKAATGGKGALEVRLCQLVKLMRGGEPVKMSKRSGDFVTLREVIDEVGRDAIRFMMLDRKNDAELEFDLAKVIEQSKENPVFYVQYAHARIASVLRQAALAFESQPLAEPEIEAADLSILKDEGERAVMRLVAQFPRLIEQATATREPHRVVFYLYDLASSFHGLWNRGKDLPDLRFINNDDRKGTLARLALVKAVKTVIANGLGLLGVSAPEEMR